MSDEPKYQLTDPSVILRHKVGAIESINARSKVGAIREEGSFSITFDTEVSAEQVKAWAWNCAAYTDTIGRLKSVSKLWIAKSVIEYAARKEMSLPDALDDMEIPEIIGLSTKTILHAVAVVARLGPDAFIEGLSDAQLMCVGSFKGPVRPDLALLFAERRRNILHEAALDQSMTRGVLTRKMKDLQAELGMVMKEKREAEDNLVLYARLSYISKNATDEWLEINGLERRDVTSWLLEYEMTLQEKDILPYTIEGMELPYMLNKHSAINVESEEIPDLPED